MTVKEKEMSNEYPRPVTMRRRLGVPVYSVAFDVEQTSDEYGDVWRYHTAELPVGVFGYGAIVNAIVTAYYPGDVMQAVVNNYLLDPADEATKAEFDTMQECRKWAKQTARELIRYATEHWLVPESETE